MSVFASKFHKGNVFENLADFLLGSLGISNPPRRQFDQGYDFYCYLSEKVDGDESLLRFDYPYNIQIKSSKESSITYGSNVYKKWKKDDIHWLFHHETPFFIGFLNTDTYELKIYDTTGIWYLYVHEEVNCSRITFKAGNVPPDDLHNESALSREEFLSRPMRSLPVSSKLKSWGPEMGDGLRHTIDMGNPIVTISVNDTKDPVTLENLKRVLRTAIQMEKKNIANRNIGINFFAEIKNNWPNDPRFIIGSTFNTHARSYVENLKGHLKEGLISLLINAAKEEDERMVEATKSMLALLPESYYDRQLASQQGDLFQYEAKSKI